MTLYNKLLVKTNMLKNLNNNYAIMVNLIQYIQELSLLPKNIKKELFIYIDKTNFSFANIEKTTALENVMVYRCNTYPFIVIALSGIAMVYGIPNDPCRGPVRVYGYQDYDYSYKREGEKPNEICSRIKKYGRKKYLFLKLVMDKIESVIINCEF